MRSDGIGEPSLKESSQRQRRQTFNNGVSDPSIANVSIGGDPLKMTNGEHPSENQYSNQNIFSEEEKANYLNLRRILPILEELKATMTRMFPFLRDNSRMEELRILKHSSRFIQFFDLDIAYLINNFDPISEILSRPMYDLLTSSSHPRFDLLNVQEMALAEMGFLGNSERCF